MGSEAIAIHEDDARPGASRHWLTLVLYCAASLLLYADAFEGAFFSDDINNIVANEYIHELTAANSLELLRPGGAPAKLTQNYAPVHMFAHAAEWALFRDGVVGYHVVNALLHAVAAFLFTVLLVRSGLHRWVALAGGSYFLVHPANVESVAWIYQLKTILALIFGLLALLLFDRRPALAFAAFGAAILSKVLAAFALPVALAMWIARGAATSERAAGSRSLVRHPLVWLAAWAAALAALAMSVFGIFASTNANVPPLDADPFVVARTIVAIGGRYLLMSLSSYGVSAFQEVALARSWSDPWWLGSALVLALLAWRGIWALLRRREEGAYWLWAACSFAPICQLFPFLHPMADRYLYFILPGLIGASLLALQHAFASRRAVGQPDSGALARGGRWVAVGLCLAWLSVLTVRSVERVHLWRYPVLLQKDAIQRHPEGLLANNFRARQAAAAGDAETALAALWLTVERGDLRYRELLGDPAWAPLQGDPRFQAIIAEIARRWLALLPRYRDPSQVELFGFAEAAALLTQYNLAEELLERALAVGGRRDETVRAQLERVRRARKLEAALAEEAALAAEAALAVEAAEAVPADSPR